MGPLFCPQNNFSSLWNAVPRPEFGLVSSPKQGDVGYWTYFEYKTVQVFER